MTRRYKRVAQDFSGETLTQRHFAPSCDVNRIVETYDRTGIDPFADRAKDQRFGDGMYRTYKEAMDHVAGVRSAFQELPQAVQDRFGDAESYLAYLDAQTRQPPSEASEAPEEPLEPPATEGDKGGS